MAENQYVQPATSMTPGLVIYLIDISTTMKTSIDGIPRIKAVEEALHASYKKMISYSTKSTGIVAPRYRLAYILYSEKAFWIEEKIFTITELAKKGVPELPIRNETNTYSAFKKAEEILNKELRNIKEHPAPLICHITDGEYTGRNPLSVVERIKKMSIDDGNVLIENIFISDRLLAEPVTSIKDWSGITNETKFNTPYADTLRSMSSGIPASYQQNVNKHNYNLSNQALLMIPGVSLELVKLGFMIAGATPRTWKRRSN